MAQRQSEKRDYYEVLGLERNASEADVKRAYRNLARKYHPDVNRDDPEAEERMKQISEAYAVLSDSERRARYDRYGHDGPGEIGFEGGIPDIFDLFSSVFGGDPFGFASVATRREAVGQSLRYDVQITLEEVLTGTEREVRYHRTAACEVCDGSGAAPGSTPRICSTCGGVGRVRTARNTFMGAFTSIAECPHCDGRGETVDTPCEECRGSGVVRREERLTIHVPPGTRSGDDLVLRGFGEAPVGGGRTGDLHVRVFVANHERFVRRDDDLHAELLLSFPQAALGGVVTADGLDGPVEVTVPPGLQTGEQITVAGRGLPRARTGPRGDLILHARVVTPTRLTPRQRELLEALAAESGETVADPEKGFFARIKDALSGD